MGLLSQTKDAEKIAKEVNLQQILEDDFKSLNSSGGYEIESETVIAKIYSRLEDHKFRVSIKVELINENHDGYEDEDDEE